MIVFKSYVDAGQELNDDDKKNYYTALLEYLTYGKEPDISGASKAVFVAIKPSLDKQKVKAEAGAAGGKAKARNLAEAKQTASKALANSKQSSSKTLAEAKQTASKRPSKSLAMVRVMVKSSSSKPLRPLEPLSGKPDCSDAVVDYLNAKSGKHFKHTSSVTQRLIAARVHDGYKPDDFKTVIDSQCKEWLSDPHMERYIRPETLFGTKFEGYLNAKGESDESEPPYSGVF
ncbi:MAG: conserved phage C-terminal domain-containing protein [Eggerthellaceae bacterium]|jgi:uncharacterized phage protein (TIGR02220 family)|nr:conserved phage C-terminal domain-containing protein [Eggerthellaceae bacterium]MCH4220470.1 conserved phage C-terminal domain-containing protein [Eggerthellaceae bacterium]